MRGFGNAVAIVGAMIVSALCMAQDRPGTTPHSMTIPLHKVRWRYARADKTEKADTIARRSAIRRQRWEAVHGRAPQCPPHGHEETGKAYRFRRENHGKWVSARRLKAIRDWKAGDHHGPPPWAGAGGGPGGNPNDRGQGREIERGHGRWAEDFRERGEGRDDQHAERPAWHRGGRKHSGG